jgi:RNA polymerase sigma-70 factor (ECF subfamily)
MRLLLTAIPSMSTPFRATDLSAELPRLRRYARVLTGDPEVADTLVEEALLRFRCHAGEADSQSTRSLELMALLRDVAAENALAGRHPLFLASSSQPAKWLAGSASSARSLPARAAETFAHVGELPPEQREVLLLVAVERLSYTDIAALLSVPVATVVSRLSAAREALHAAALKAKPAPNNAR